MRRVLGLGSALKAKAKCSFESFVLLQLRVLLIRRSINKDYKRSFKIVDSMRGSFAFVPAIRLL